MHSLTGTPADAADDINLVLLQIAFPGFWFSQYIREQRVRWVAVRKNGADQGLHTMVTGELDELCAALLSVEAGRDDPDPGPVADLPSGPAISPNVSPEVAGNLS